MSSYLLNMLAREPGGLNRIGESRNFSNMTSLQVYNLLERVKDKVASIKTDDDVKNVF